MDDWTVIVMAAGKGTRMRSRVPKVLHPVAGLPMLAHALRAARHLSPGATLMVVTPSDRAAIAASVGDGVECVEQPDPLGTGNALASAIPRVPFSSTHVLVLNGDTPLLRGDTLRDLAALHLSRGAALTLLSATLPMAEAVDMGRVKRGARRKPIAIVEASEAGLSRETSVEVNVGVYAMDATWLRGAIADLAPHASGEYYLTDLAAAAVADGRRVEVLTTDEPDQALGVNNRAQLARAETAMQKRLREHWMERGVTLTDPATTYIDAGVELSPDVTVHPNTALQGTTRVASGATLGPNARIADTEIGENATVGASTMEGATLAAEVHVGQYCHLREGTRLARGAYVGSQVEIKNSQVGEGTHIGHFSYVGDAVIGARVNIGAGVVTCNYDGVGKHVTEIGDGAFIGSDSMLVAPVKVGESAVTGAGAVVNRDVPAGETVVGVPARALRGSTPLAGPARDR